MKKELNFVYEKYIQIENLKKGLDKDFTLIEEINPKEDYNFKYERWMLIKQNSNNLLFIIVCEDRHFGLEDDGGYRVVSKIRILNKFNQIYYNQNKNNRYYITLFLQFLIIIAIYGLYKLLIFLNQNGFSLMQMLIPLVILGLYLYDKIKDSEKIIDFDKIKKEKKPFF